ncbi:MAG TPA: hypothetical protein VNK52_09820 [Hyphomicrobiaceae bacterium]|nr:hypothetical protein [Hyphomicrobiaceae bacterium]
MTDVSDTGPLKPAHVRLLKIAVVTMGILILAGFGAVVLRIAHLASNLSEGGSAPGNIELRARLALPPGAVIRLMALSGDRLALHYDGPEGAGIAVVNLSTGAVVSRFGIVRETPSP